VLAVASITMAPCSAHAAVPPPSAEDRALAEALFREGRTLTEQGDHHQACDKFAESQRLDPALGTLLNLAECHATVGRTASAWAELHESMELARRLGQEDRVAYAQSRIAAIEKTLSYARIDLPRDLQPERVAIDGRQLGRSAYTTRLPLDPGAHEVTISSERGTTTTRFVLPPGPAEHVVRLPIANESPPPRPLDRDPDEEEGADARAIAGYVSLALGVVGVGVGTYFGVRAMNLKSESDEHCDATGCDQQGIDRFDDARAHANLATAGFVVAGAAIALGGGLLIWAAAEPSGGVDVAVAGVF
jgi:tetratricopeptide (TPR) repeat protein